MQLDLNKIPSMDAKAALTRESDNYPKQDIVTSSSQVSSTGVIKKVLMTRTEISIYPNGQVFQNSKTWFADGARHYTPQKKKLTKKLSGIEANTKQKIIKRITTKMNKLEEI